MIVILFVRFRDKREIRGDTRPRPDEDVDLVTVYTDVYNMRIELEKMRKPIGTRDSPARTCKDLSHGHSKLEDGESVIKSSILYRLSLEEWKRS